MSPPFGSGRRWLSCPSRHFVGNPHQRRSAREPVREFVAELASGTSPATRRSTVMTCCAGFGSARRSAPRGTARAPKAIGTSSGGYGPLELSAGPIPGKVAATDRERERGDREDIICGRGIRRERSTTLSVLSALLRSCTGRAAARGASSLSSAPPGSPPRVGSGADRRSPIFQPRSVTEAALEPLRGSAS